MFLTSFLNGDDSIAPVRQGELAGSDSAGKKGISSCKNAYLYNTDVRAEGSGQDGCPQETAHRLKRYFCPNMFTVPDNFNYFAKGLYLSEQK